MVQNKAHSKGKGFVLRHNKSGFKLQKKPTKILTI